MITFNGIGRNQNVNQKVYNKKSNSQVIKDGHAFKDHIHNQEFDQQKKYLNSDFDNLSDGKLFWHEGGKGEGGKPNLKGSLSLKNSQGETFKIPLFAWWKQNQYGKYLSLNFSATSNSCDNETNENLANFFRKNDQLST